MCHSTVLRNHQTTAMTAAAANSQLLHLSETSGEKL